MSFPQTALQSTGRWAIAGACKYAQGWCFTTIICEQSLYIPWLMDRALRAGVSLQCRTIQDLQVANSFPDSIAFLAAQAGCSSVSQQSAESCFPVKVCACDIEHLHVVTKVKMGAGASRLLCGRQLHWPGSCTAFWRHGDVPGPGSCHSRQGALD